jgi:hypothetical protein
LATGHRPRWSATANPLSPRLKKTATSFYDRSSKLVYSHPGVYQNEGQLTADVNRYAG